MNIFFFLRIELQIDTIHRWLIVIPIVALQYCTSIYLYKYVQRILNIKKPKKYDYSAIKFSKGLVFN